MKLKRIVFSKKDNRDETDKKWDLALGSVLGAAGGSSVGTSIGKAIEDDGRFDREVTEKDLEKRKIKRAGKIDKEYNKLIKEAEKQSDPIKKIVETDNLEKTKGLKLKNLESEFKVSKDKLKDARISGKPIKVKRKLALPLAAAGAVIGTVVGSKYGRDNNLKKQRDKIEDAAGDRVAEVIRGIGKKGK
jgi:hypothetical protein